MSLPTQLAPLLTRLAPGSGALPPLQVTHSTPAVLPPATLAAAFPHASPRLSAVLALCNDEERAHSIAQDNEGEATCDLVHAIHHRREADFSNSKYWYRTLSHPLLPQLYGDKAPVQQACALVDAVQAVTRGAGTACGAGRLAELKARQAEELRVLLQWTLEQEQAK